MSVGHENEKGLTGIVTSYLSLKGLGIRSCFSAGSLDKLIGAVKNDLIFINLNNIKDDRFKLIYNIYGLGMIEAAEKKKSVIFIPHSNKTYWELSTDMYGVYKIKAPFIAPALSEIAMINGLPTGISEQELKSLEYGYRGYKFPQKQQVAEDSLDKLYQEAISKGFSQLIVIDGNIKKIKLNQPMAHKLSSTTHVTSQKE